MRVRIGMMTRKTITTLFSGAGGCDRGAIAAGFEHCQAIEYDPQIAEIFKANIGDCHVMNILDADPFKFERPDVLHASPPCPNFSVAKKDAKEAPLDIDYAKKVADFISVLQPQYFTLENVEAYRKSKSFNLIVETLYKLGYWVTSQVLNSADLGVPQSRRRLVLIAVKDGFIPPLPPKEKHVGWYEAIADLVHDLPDSKLADWQFKRLPTVIQESLLTELQNTSRLATTKKAEEPCFTITAGVCRRPISIPQAILIENTGARSDRPLQTRNPEEPCWTLRAMGQDGHWHRANALLENASIKALDIACLARLHSFPDDWLWTSKKSLDGKAIGNSVPPLMYQKIIESVCGQTAIAPLFKVKHLEIAA